MKHINTRRGFTLIELLVVVLIIGILAAVAVPQYKLAVDKARLAPYIQNVHDILKAEKIYYLANGNYTTDIQILDLDLTKSCRTFSRGTDSSELYNCLGGIGFNLGSAQTLQLSYCAELSTRCSSAEVSAKKAHMNMHYKLNGEILFCNSYTNRGKRLCDYLSAH